MTFREALRSAMIDELVRDDRMVIMGQDIGVYGGAFKVTQGLLERFGPDRIIETPISENSVAGAAVGAAVTGLRPVLEFMFMDFMALAMDQICNHGAKLHYMYNGQCHVPVVFRAPYGGGFGYGASHSQALEAWFMHTPGLKVVIPSTPAAAKGLLTAAIRDDGPVVYLENKALYNLEGQVPEEPFTIEIGTAQVVRPGSDVTVAGYGRTVWLAIEAARRLEKRVSMEVIDLRTIAPLDRQLLVDSVGKTGRLLTVEDDCLTGGVGAEVGATVAESVTLASPIARVGCADVPMPCCEPLERAALPSVDKVIAAVERIVESPDELVHRDSEDRRERNPSHRRRVACSRR
jgi:pyruvate/2-oxoglutarate/acetoin dehydrogenase E1 component